jgi:chaperonin GroES
MQQQQQSPMQGMPQGMPQQMPQPQMPPAPKKDNKLDRLIETVNIAKELDEELLVKIGEAVVDGYKRDTDSKSMWDSSVDSWIKLATQVKENRSWPWPNAANVKYPLLSTAALQFAARAYPALIPADGKVVQMKVIGLDQQGQKAAKAQRLADHMNYQLLVDMPDWEEEMDKLLFQLPIMGCLFKKTYFDDLKKSNCSRLLGPKDLIVNYWAASLESAYRVTEAMAMTKNMIQEKVNADLYLEVELPDPTYAEMAAATVNIHGNTPPDRLDASTPYLVLEQHTYWDLDDDGYEEPYIITVEERSKKVLRIVARWDSDGINTNVDGELVNITPVGYYTKYSFIPNPDGGFYDIGFGHLLGPLNESANTIINQLLDAGTLSNLQSGFIGKGLRLKMGEQRFQPGEWKSVNATGDDIKKQIFPLPTKEPSEVLFKLLGLVIESSEKLASVAEIFVGKMPGQNTPATTTMASIEQGMKVFTAIYKRVYRSLSHEFKKVFRLNGLYQENLDKAQHILDQPLTAEDYDPKAYDVCPTADPTAVSSTQKLLKAEGLMQVLPLGTLNVMEVTKRILEAQEQPNLEALMQNPTPQPDPKAEALKAKAQMDKEKHQMDMVAKKMDLQFKQQEAMMDQKFMQMEKMMEFKLKEMEFGQESQHQMRQAQLDQMTGSMEMGQLQQEHQISKAQSQEQHQQKMTQSKEKHEQQRKQSADKRLDGKSGNKAS